MRQPNVGVAIVATGLIVDALAPGGSAPDRLWVDQHHRWSSNRPHRGRRHRDVTDWTVYKPIAGGELQHILADVEPLQAGIWAAVPARTQTPARVWDLINGLRDRILQEPPTLRSEQAGLPGSSL